MSSGMDQQRNIMIICSTSCIMVVTRAVLLLFITTDCTIACVAAAAGGRQLLQSGPVTGIDVSGNNGAIDWSQVSVDFAYVKSTEGLVSPNRTLFAQQYNGAHSAGIIRGAYHFGRPDVSTGAAQASYFVQNGGGWSADGHTLPGALDMEWCPTGDSCPTDSTCYGLSAQQMGAWIGDFINTYKSLTGIYPVIYTNAKWYAPCVGDFGDFSSTCPLWLSGSSTNLPYNWGLYTFYQSGPASVSHATTTVDQNIFNGPLTQLQVLATNG